MAWEKKVLGDLPPGTKFSFSHVGNNPRVIVSAPSVYDATIIKKGWTIASVSADPAADSRVQFSKVICDVYVERFRRFIKDIPSGSKFKFCGREFLRISNGVGVLKNSYAIAAVREDHCLAEFLAETKED